MTFIRQKIVVPALAACAMALSTVSMAAIDAAVTTELTTAKTDVLTIGGLVFVIAIGIMVYKWFKRAL